MSYHPPHQSSRGDDEFIDDSWSQTSAPTKQSLGNINGQTLQPTYSQIPNPVTSNLQPTQNLIASPDVTTLAKSITQEDVLFMRGFQKDSFVYRVLPLTVLGWSALFMYNKSKMLPHSISRYLMVGATTFLLGKWSYRNEFKRRLVQNGSNTPFMQAARQAMGLQQIVETKDSFGGDSGLTYGSSAGNDSSEWNNAELHGESRLSATSGFRQPAFRQSSQDTHSSFGTENHEHEPSKQSVTYEELRAKNRGLIK